MGNNSPMSTGDRSSAGGTPDDGKPTRDGHTESMLPERELQFPPTLHHVHRRPFGLSPAPLLVAVAAASLVIALVLLALGSWIAGILFLAVSAVAAGLFVVAIRREPDEQTSRLAATAADRADGLARLAAVGVSASTRAGIEWARLWGRRRRLRYELSRRLGPLGEAVHRDDQERAEHLKAQADELDRALAGTDRRAADAIAALRKQIKRERATTQGTELIPVVDEAAVSDGDGLR